MALPPDLPPDGTALQRVRRINRLKADTRKLSREREAIRRRLRRQAYKSILYVIFLYGAAYSIIDLTFGLFLQIVDPTPVWIFGFLIPTVCGPVAVGIAAVEVSQDTHRRIRIAIDTRHYRDEIRRLQRLQAR